MRLPEDRLAEKYPAACTDKRKRTVDEYKGFPFKKENDKIKVNF